ncbi:MAG: hypothetical protein ACFFD4_04530 [Candidatus Odinarchaeota archaeon]
MRVKKRTFTGFRGLLDTWRKKVAIFPAKSSAPENSKIYHFKGKS